MKELVLIIYDTYIRTYAHDKDYGRCWDCGRFSVEKEKSINEKILEIFDILNDIIMRYEIKNIVIELKNRDFFDSIANARKINRGFECGVSGESKERTNTKDEHMKVCEKLNQIYKKLL